MTGSAGSFRWVAGGLHPDASFPEPQVAQDALDDVGIVNEGDSRARWGRARQVGVPPLVAGELEALVGHMLGDAGDKVGQRGAQPPTIRVA